VVGKEPFGSQSREAKTYSPVHQMSERGGGRRDSSFLAGTRHVGLHPIGLFGGHAKSPKSNLHLGQERRDRLMIGRGGRVLHSRISGATSRRAVRRLGESVIKRLKEERGELGGCRHFLWRVKNSRSAPRPSRQLKEKS